MNEVLIQGISVMCIGMGTVIIFLCITIASMLFMSKIVGKLNLVFPEVVPQTAGGARKSATSNDEEIAVAILSAIFGKK